MSAASRFRVPLFCLPSCGAQGCPTPSSTAHSQCTLIFSCHSIPSSALLSPRPHYRPTVTWSTSYPIYHGNIPPAYHACLSCFLCILLSLACCFMVRQQEFPQLFLVCFFMSQQFSISGLHYSSWQVRFSNSPHLPASLLCSIAYPSPHGHPFPTSPSLLLPSL